MRPAGVTCIIFEVSYAAVVGRWLRLPWLCAFLNPGLDPLNPWLLLCFPLTVKSQGLASVLH